MAGFLDKANVPSATVPRLARYLRILHKLEEEGVDKVASKELADRLGANAAQIRKDFSYFGEFGVRGVGYEVDYLIEQLSRCLGLNQNWKVAIVGAGKLGGALARYRGFQEEGFDLIGIFDSSKHLVGTSVDGKEVQSQTVLSDFIRDSGVDIVIITVPAYAAQRVAIKAVEGGVKGILNFAPVRLEVDSHVLVRQVDMSTELMVLSFYLSQGC